MSRRDGRRGARTSGGVKPLLTAHALSGWDTATALGTTSGGGVGGDASSGVSVVAAILLNSLPSGTQRIAERRATTNGWQIRSSGSNLEVVAGNGTTAVAAVARTWAAADVGKVHIVGLSCDLAGVTAMCNNAVLGTSALTGYSVASQRTMMGSAPNGAEPASHYAILGVAGRNAPMAAVDFKAVCKASRSMGRLAFGSVSFEHAWIVPEQEAVPSSIADSIGSDDMSFVVGTAANLAMEVFKARWRF